MGCGGAATRPTNYGEGLGAVTEVEAPAASATFYSTDSIADSTILGTSRTAEVREAIERAGTDAGITMQGDGRLAVLAGWLAERLGPHGALPPSNVIQYFARHLGIPEPTWNQFLVGEPDDVRFLAAVQHATAHYVGDTHDNRYGASIVERDGLVLAMVVLTARHLQLAPIERTQALNSTVRVVGSLQDGFANARVIVTAPNGQTQEHHASSGTAFDETVQLSTAGVYQVEVMGDAGQGAVVLANMPLYVGVSAPTSVSIRQVDESGEPPTEESVQDALLTRINDTRHSFGLAPLTRDSRVDAIAHAHSEDMRDHNFIAHVSPTTGSPSDRIVRAGLHASLGAENIGRAYSADEIHEGLLDSPGHRANILLREATHVGIGVVSVQDAGRIAFIATEVFVKLAQPIDVTSAPEALLSQANAVRASHHLAPLTADSELRAIADESARTFLATPGMTNNAAVEAASRELSHLGNHFTRGVAALTVVTALADAASVDAFLQADLPRVGIGIAQGDRPDTGPNSIVVVLVFAAPR